MTFNCSNFTQNGKRLKQIVNSEGKNSLQPFSKELKVVLLYFIMTWMTVEMKSRMRGTAPIRTSNTHCSIHHIATGSIDETKGISYKCWICNTQTHWTDECQRFLAQNHENRLKIVQENHVCYSYLKELEETTSPLPSVDESSAQRKRMVYSAANTTEIPAKFIPWKHPVRFRSADQRNMH